MSEIFARDLSSRFSRIVGHSFEIFANFGIILEIFADREIFTQDSFPGISLKVKFLCVLYVRDFLQYRSPLPPHFLWQLPRPVHTSSSRASHPKDFEGTARSTASNTISLNFRFRHPHLPQQPPCFTFHTRDALSSRWHSSVGAPPVVTMTRDARTTTEVAFQTSTPGSLFRRNDKLGALECRPAGTWVLLSVGQYDIYPTEL